MPHSKTTTATTSAIDPDLRDFVEHIRAAAAEGIPLHIQGAGSKDFYGGEAAGALLSTRGHSGIVDYAPSELVVTVRSGTPLQELETLLASERQCLAYEPPRFAATQAGAAHGGTVGGMVAAGLSGPSRASVGAVRDHLLGVNLINGRGEAMRFGGTVMKNVAGYDVSRAMAGALGTLGLMTELSLKVMPLWTAEATLQFECSQGDALRLLNGWGGLPLPLNASVWRAGAGETGLLRLRLRGAVAAIASACVHLGGERIEDEVAQPFWEGLRDHRDDWFKQAGTGSTLDLWRVSVPQTAPPLAIEGETPLIEWHGAQRWYRRAPGAGKEMRAAAQAVGGHATLFAEATTGTTSATRDPRFEPLSPALARIHHSLLREFDPQGIFNRGRLLPVH